MNRFFASFLLLFAYAMLPAQLAPIRLVSTYVDTATGQLEGRVIQWDADSGIVSSNVPTGYPTFLAGSSFFDAYSGLYSFRATADTTSEVLRFDVDSLGFQPMLNTDALSNAVEVDMRTGRIWGLMPVSSNDYGLVEYIPSNPGLVVAGAIPEVRTLFVDANCYNSNGAKFYFIALDDSLRKSLFTVSTDTSGFSYTRIDISGIDLPLASSLEYDNEANKIYVLYTMQDSIGGPANAQLAELNPATGVATLVLDMPQYRYFQTSSQTFDQASGSIVFIGIEANFTYSLNIYSFFTGQLRTGTLPMGILPYNLEVDNTAFARAKYGSLTAIQDRFSRSKLECYPVPATTVLNMQADDRITSAEVWDLNGRRMQVAFDEAGQSLSVEGLPAGVYVLVAQGTTSGAVYTHRFVKQ